jgi:hypothetical protein
MDDGGGHARRIEGALADLYSGPLDGFVRGRDALVMDLRSAGDRESATMVKALRKPSRVAWALNLGVQSDQSAFAALETAVAATLEAHSSGGDVRGATAALRKAVRNLASESAGAAERAGQRIAVSILASAVVAVVGRPDSFNQLRSRQLADVPDAGGLDFLATLAARDRALPMAASARELVAERDRVEDAEVQESARRATKRLDSAHARAEGAERELREADSEAVAAEERVRQAESDLASARRRRETARTAAEAAAAELRNAKAASAAAHQQLNDARLRSQRTP